MTHWNFELFENFKSAARELGLEVKSDWEYYSVILPNKNVYAYCWTPLNKMRDLARNERTPDRALEHIKHNQDDFHLEFDTREYDATMVFADMFAKSTSVDTIKKALNLLLDSTALERRIFITDMKYSTEEYSE